MSADLDGLQAIVVGAGIGGLTAALCLARRGAAVTVLERSPALGEVGAGIQISPNGSAVLAALGVLGRLGERALAGRAVELRDHRRGRMVLRLDLGQVPSPHPWLFLHRADLVGALAGAAAEAGIAVVLDAEVAAVDPGDRARRPRVDLADRTPSPATVGGAHETAGTPPRPDRHADDRPTERRTDLVVLADGVRSAVRYAIGPAPEPSFAGQAAWRALVPLQDGAGPSDPVARVWMGPGRHLVAYPVRGGRLINLVAVTARRDWIPEGWSHPDDPAAPRHAFASFGPEPRALLDRARDVHLWGLFRHPVARHWHRGRAVLVGDAAHPTLPFLAQGACMAIEDGWVLAGCLAAARREGRTWPEVALQRYAALRRPRCRRIVGRGSANALAYHLPALVAPAAHTLLRGVARLRPHAALRGLDWLYCYDPTAAFPVPQAASETQTGA